jgi:hypothetical protein
VALLAVCAAVQASEPHAQVAAGSPEFTLAPERGLVGDFIGFGAQFNQHVYAKISGPPPGLPALEQKAIAARPRLVRVFFNTTEWAFPDRMDSFLRTVGLAYRADAQINVTWQGSSYAFATANMARFADVIAEIVAAWGMSSLWVTLFNEPNSTRLTLAQYEDVYRQLDGHLRTRGIRDRVHFMGGDLLGSTSPLGQSQVDWFKYMAARMGDLLEAWSVHVYWDFWDAEKIDRRLRAEVRTIFAAIPAPTRRPLFVTEFGVRGLPTFEGESTFQPGLAPDGTPMTQTNVAAFQQAWFMLRAANLGFSGTAKWDLYAAKYDSGTQDHSAIGPGNTGWPLRPVYHVMQLMTTTMEPRGGRIVDLVPAADVEPSKLVMGYISPASNITVAGLDTRGAQGETSSESASFSIGGLPPNTLFRLLLWNRDDTGTNADAGFVDSGPSGTVELSVPLQAVFVLTTTPLMTLPW